MVDKISFLSDLTSISGVDVDILDILSHKMSFFSELRAEKNIVVIGTNGKAIGGGYHAVGPGSNRLEMGIGSYTPEIGT